jgi:hypothetical protein
LATETENATIYYVQDGPLSTLASAQTFSSSSGSFTIPASGSTDERDIYAVAVGPGMLPSPHAHGTITVYPLMISVSQTGSPISEDSGSGSFIITASEAPDSPVTINLKSGDTGTYEVGDFTSAEMTGGPGSTFTKVLPAGQSSVTVQLDAVADSGFEDETVILELQPGTGYGEGDPSFATITITDNDTKPRLTMNHEMKDGISEGGDDWLSLSIEAGDAPSSDLAVTIQTSGSYEATDIVGWGYAPPPYDPFPAAGGTFTLTIPAGQMDATWEIRSAVDAEFDDETVTITIVPDPARYELGAVTTLNLTILDGGV